MAWSDYPKRSPKINHVSWGHIDVEGVGSGRDFKLYPGGGREWDWNETGTHHSPGIQPADVQEILVHGSSVVVLSRGMLLALRTARETIDLLERGGVPFHIKETKAAVKVYNDLAEAGEQVGGLFHSTC
jgi:hypothetical protein